MGKRTNERTFEVVERFFEALLARGFRPEWFYCGTGDDGLSVASSGPQKNRLDGALATIRRRPSIKPYRRVLAMTRNATLLWDDVAMTLVRRGSFLVAGRRVSFLVAASFHVEGKKRFTSLYASIDDSGTQVRAHARRTTHGLRASWKLHRDGWMYWILDSPPNVRSATRLAERVWSGLATTPP